VENCSVVPPCTKAKKKYRRGVSKPQESSAQALLALSNERRKMRLGNLLSRKKKRELYDLAWDGEARRLAPHLKKLRIKGKRR
jgi:hypothetical protein